MTEIIEADEATFENLISSGKVLIDFNAEWCGPCKMLGVILKEQVAPKVEGVKILSVNIDQNPNIAALYQVQSIPTLVYMKDGETIETLIGVQKAQDIVDLINS